ncbi:hypothetical protein HaLaN_11011 [Haematococcus lacustris]|uniref:Uncharacterized protein n=1 Tax=Haematococcus lacustris TaxID=44745 RepID=A0A699Z6V3_HAELA|nr:hypothetical protein HaLaN_11011 [Haematococcus lacustris]
MMRSGSFPKEVALLDICMPSREVLAHEVDVRDLVLLLKGMAASGWGSASLMYDRVMVASLNAVERCQAGEVASFMRVVAGLATAPRTDLKLSRRPGVLYDTVGSLRLPRPQDWLEAVQARLQPWLPDMNALGVEDRSWLLSSLALDLQAQLPDRFLYLMLAPLAAPTDNAMLKKCRCSVVGCVKGLNLQGCRLACPLGHSVQAGCSACMTPLTWAGVELVQHTSRAPGSHDWSAQLLAAVELRLILKRPPQRRNPTPEDIAGEAILSRCIATALDCLPAFTSTGLRLLNPAHGQEQSGEGSVPPTAAQEERCPPPRSGSGLRLPPAPPLAAPGGGAGPAGQDSLCFEAAGGEAASGMAQGGHQPGAIHVCPAASALPCVAAPAGPHAQPAAGGHGSQAHPVDLALGLAGLYAALADPQRRHQDSAGQQAESIAQTARLLAKVWLPCHKIKPDLLLALPRAELLLVSQALQAMLCKPNAAKQGASPVLMAVADGSVGLVRSQALAALTPDSVWLVRWAQAMDVHQAAQPAQAVNGSSISQTSSDACSQQEATSITWQLMARDASSNDQEEEGEGSSVLFPGAGAAGGVERLSPPSAVQVAHMALDMAITVAPLSLGLDVVWPKPLVTLVEDSLGVLAAQLEQGSVLAADMAAVEHYVSSVAQPLGGELPLKFMEAYVGRAMQVRRRCVWRQRAHLLHAPLVCKTPDCLYACHLQPLDPFTGC